MQQHSLLATKLNIPRTRPQLVSRPRLTTRLSSALPPRVDSPKRHDTFPRALTLISAPAGFGKTTLISEWVREVKTHRGAPQIAWLSLDKGDSHPVRFLAYLITALRTIEANIAKGILSALQSPHPPPVEDILTVLINEIAAIPYGIVLILDDYHLVDSQPTHDALTFLLEHLPLQLHLVIATREDPILPLARLRAGGQLNELRATDLRFSSAEASEFLNQVMGLDLSVKDIAALETRTEGWIAGLHLAAVSMQGHKDATSFIKSFTGSHRFVLDYLIEEVLEQQPGSIQTFLLQTSILNRLTGSLCDALTGQNNGQATLEMLDRANLFMVRLDHERHWYRYHHLFAELLQQRLRIAHPNVVDSLHSKAAIWHEMNGNLSEAIRHALIVDDIETASRLIEKGSLEALERSELGFILNWVDRLPCTALESSPWLFVYHAWALLLTGQVDDVSSRLEDTEWLLHAIEKNDETQKQEMLGFIAGLKAILALWQRDFAGGLAFAHQALECMPRNNWIRGYCAIVMGSSFWGNGNLAAAKDAYAESFSVGTASGNTMLAVSAACNLAHSLELEGHLQQAMELFEDSFHLAQNDGHVLPVAGYVHVELARGLYELNDLDSAAQHLKEGIKLCQQIVDGRAEKIGHCLLARVHLAQGKHADALDSIQKAEVADPSPGTPFDLRGAEYPQIRLWLKEKNLKELGAWLKENGVDGDDVSHVKAKLTYTMHARVLIALGREQHGSPYLNEALDLLSDLLEVAESNGWVSKVIEILALQALALQEQEDSAQAITTLERALLLAEPEGYIRSFVDEGPPMGRLLCETAARGFVPAYARRLLAAFPVAHEVQPELSEPQPPELDVVEPLSERELEILQLVADGLTNREIASQLFLALNTVKAHTRNIYGKLNVHSRTQAIARSQELGLLPRR